MYHSIAAHPSCLMRFPYAYTVHTYCTYLFVQSCVHLCYIVKKVDKVRVLLMRQRDIIVALTQSLNARDEQVKELQNELDIYDKEHVRITLYTILYASLCTHVYCM